MHGPRNPSNSNSAFLYRESLFREGLTNCYRVAHGGSDGIPGCYLDRLGDFLLYQSEFPPDPKTKKRLKQVADLQTCRGVYFKQLDRLLRTKGPEEKNPVWIMGEAAEEEFFVTENGLKYAVRFNEGYSCGLFIDQRENRKRILNRQITASWNLTSATPGKPFRVLNTFAYTCSFSVCSAHAGMETTSLDLSRKYLDWGKRNFELNSLNPEHHDFIYGEVFNWMNRLAKKGRQYDLIILDPPTFSTSKENGVFQVQKRLPDLIRLSLELLPGKGTLLISSNKSDWSKGSFLATVETAFRETTWIPARKLHCGQPADFPVGMMEKPYLNTCWIEAVRNP